MYLFRTLEREFGWLVKDVEEICPSRRALDLHDCMIATIARLHDCTIARLLL
jgi:hypothetical protein